MVSKSLDAGWSARMRVANVDTQATSLQANLEQTLATTGQQMARRDIHQLS
jgi:hypothetical protein